ncbi:MAG TPA: ATP-binding cassette domain-containing protein [Mycobacteriales bacterium]|nr:ATP-binding cassette domain-containing protein [Mycobacteriales bacterium]
MPLIELSGVDKTFTVRRRTGRLRRARQVVRAVGDLSFTVDAGELVAYIGPNGAGKSTTVKMLTGILVPSAGRVRVDGLDPARQRRELAGRVGVVFGQRTTLWWDLPLRDSFDLLRRLYRITPSRYRANLDRYVDLLELGPLLATPVRQLSLGQRMRGDLTAALLHDPVILYLDEPTIGLDVTSKAAVRAFLAEMNRDRGTTILLTTHDLDDVERLCRRVMVIDNGRLGFDGDLTALRAHAAAERTLVVDLLAPAPPIELPGARVVRVDGPRQWLSFPAETRAAPLVAAVMERYPVADIALREPDIADVVARLYAESSRRA